MPSVGNVSTHLSMFMAAQEGVPVTGSCFMSIVGCHTGKSGVYSELGMFLEVSDENSYLTTSVPMVLKGPVRGSLSSTIPMTTVGSIAGSVSGSCNMFLKLFDNSTCVFRELSLDEILLEDLSTCIATEPTLEIIGPGCYVTEDFSTELLVEDLTDCIGSGSQLASTLNMCIVGSNKYNTHTSIPMFIKTIFGNSLNMFLKTHEVPITGVINMTLFSAIPINQFVNMTMSNTKDQLKGFVKMFTRGW